MDAIQFAYWLQGFVELHGEQPSKEQWEIIKEHLGLVFNKVTKKTLTPEPAYCEPVVTFGEPCNLDDYMKPFPDEPFPSGFYLPQETGKSSSSRVRKQYHAHEIAPIPLPFSPQNLSENFYVTSLVRDCCGNTEVQKVPITC